MKKVLCAALGVLVFVTVLAAPVGAGRTETAYAELTALAPIYVTSSTDDYGDYCEYEAEVTLSWKGTVRLWVSQFVKGRRGAPGELRLTGSGKNVSVVVTGIRAEPTTAPLLAEVFVLDNSKKSWSLVATRLSESITCRAVSV